MSPITDLKNELYSRQLNKEGSVEGVREKPLTLAPCLSNKQESQDPLNPECPVIKTLLFLYFNKNQNYKTQKLVENIIKR